TCGGSAAGGVPSQGRTSVTRNSGQAVGSGWHARKCRGAGSVRVRREYAAVAGPHAIVIGARAGQAGVCKTGGAGAERGNLAEGHIVRRSFHEISRGIRGVCGPGEVDFTSGNGSGGKATRRGRGAGAPGLNEGGQAERRKCRRETADGNAV